MEKAEFKYFLNGEEVDGKLINWEYTTSITCKGNEIHVGYNPEDAIDVYSNLEYEVESITPDIFASALLNGLLGSMGIYQENEDIDNTIDSDSSNMCEEAPKTSDVGVKHNKHKAPLDIVQTRQFPKALQALALATAFGNKKYEATDKDFLNFKRVSGGSQTYFDAAARHNADRSCIDEDSGLPHTIHAVWDMMAALELSIEESGIDIQKFSKEYLEYLYISK